MYKQTPVGTEKLVVATALGQSFVRMSVGPLRVPPKVVRFDPVAVQYLDKIGGRTPLVSKILCGCVTSYW